MKAALLSSELVRRALLVSLVVGVAGVGALRMQGGPAGGTPSTASSRLRTLFETKAADAANPTQPAADEYPLRRSLPPISAELRAKGYNECMMPDPGPGPYAAYRPLSGGGRLFVPRAGGHTEDFGYDVVLHLHGHEPVRKALVQSVRGVVFAGLDLGVGSGAYEDAFAQPQAFQNLKASIEHGLKASSGDERAHIRHLALSAWSAGYGGVNSILRHAESEVDAVILLDGLHAGFSLPNKQDHRPENVSVGYIMPTIAFAAKAARGDKIFFYSHSHVDPGDYASTSVVGANILQRLGLTSEPVTDDEGRYPVVAKVDFGGFHLRNHGGRDEHAHCAHTRFIEEAVGDILEPAWQTPPALPEAPVAVAKAATHGGEGQGLSAKASPADGPTKAPSLDAIARAAARDSSVALVARAPEDAEAPVEAPLTSATEEPLKGSARPGPKAAAAHAR